MFSFTKPVPLGFVIVIISPRSYTYNLQRAADLYISCLLAYSNDVREMLHLMSPLLLLIPAYSSLLLAFEGHSSTSLSSPGGDFTLMHPVVSAKSCPNCVFKAYYHYSRSPLYLLLEISLLVSLWIYNHNDLYGSNVTLDALDLVGYHFSVDFFSTVGGVVVGGATGCFNF
jgi:hypothetical protein